MRQLTPSSIINTRELQPLIINSFHIILTMKNSINASTEMVFEYTGQGCVVPKEVTIVRFHPSVTKVKNRLCQGCNKLRKVVFNEGLQKIGVGAFYWCTSLSSVIISSTVTEIGDRSFKDCVNLGEVVLNESLQKIGDGAFKRCTSLSSITFPSTVTEIGNDTYSGCNNLNEVVFNDGLQKIGVQAFFDCTSLSSIKLPSTVTEICYGAFESCCLREVIFHGVPRKIGQYAFSNCISLERFTFPTISTRLDNLIHTGHWDDIENEVDEVRGVVERSGGELFVSTQTMGEYYQNWNRVRESLDKIIRLISYCEQKEATSIFELALWKFKLDQVDKANPIPRKKCRMDVPGPVKDIILQYLPYECLWPVPDIQSGSSESDDNESSDDDDNESSDDDDYESSDDDDDH